VLRFFEAPTALVFCATREAVRHLHGSLMERGFAAVALSGELSQTERSRALQSIRDGRARICVATDVAARGLDLPDLDLVIHADLPTNPATLLHRSGRTGRAGRKGVSVLVAAANRGRRAEQLLAAAGVRAQWEPAPDADAIRARDADRLMQDPMLVEPLAEEDVALARRLLNGRSAEEIAGAWIRQYRARLPAPEELSEAFVRPEHRARREVGPVRHNQDRHATPRDNSRAEDRSGGFVTDAAESWFSLNIGREQKADPKWLVPLICRLGQVQKRDIGAIRIFARDTRFAISAQARAGFMTALPAENPDGIVVLPATAPAGPARPERAVRKHGKGHRGQANTSRSSR
jgi:ATP-dependent RNA helicase DeaD